MVRPRNLFDNAVPSGTSVAIDWLLRLAVIVGEERYEAIALEALRPMADLMQRYPSGFGRYLSALDFHLGPVAEVALVWRPGEERAMGALLDTVFGRYQPNRVVVGAPEGDAAAAGLPLLAERADRGRPAHRLRVPALRLPAPGDGAGRARAPARRWGIIRIASLGEVS